MCKDLSKRDPLQFVKMNDSLMEAIKLFSKQGHRLLVFEEDGTFRQVISQTDIFHFLVTRHAFVGTIAEKPFWEIGLESETEVGSLGEDVSVFGALRYLRDCMISGIAICNKKGVIVTNFSAADLLVSQNILAR